MRVDLVFDAHDAEDLGGALVDAAGFGVDGGGGVALEEDVGDVAEGEEDGGGEADGAAADDDDGCGFHGG